MNRLCLLPVKPTTLFRKTAILPPWCDLWKARRRASAQHLPPIPRAVTRKCPQTVESAGGIPPIITQPLPNSSALLPGDSTRGLTWDDIILPPRTKRELQTDAIGSGKPRTCPDLSVLSHQQGFCFTVHPEQGETTVARILAAQTKAKFFTVSVAEINPNVGRRIRKSGSEVVRGGTNSSTLDYFS